MLVEQRENIVHDRVPGFGEQVRLMESGFRNAGTGILAAELGDDVVEVLLRTEAILFEHFDDGRDLPHVGDGRLFDGYTVAFGTLVIHALRDHFLLHAIFHRA